MLNRRRLLVRPSRQQQTEDDESNDGFQSSVQPLQLSELPRYQPIKLPLDDAGVRLVSELSNNHMATRVYNAQLKKSAEMLREAIGSVNDLYRERKGELQRMTERRRERGIDQPTKIFTDVQNDMDKLDIDVPSMTKEIEQSARLIIDMQVELEDEREALTWVNEQVVSHQQEARQRERLREQQKSQRRERIAAAREQRAARKGGNGENEWGSEEDGEAEEEEPEEDTQEEVSVVGVIDLLKQARETRAAHYADMDAYRKYGLNNDYISFKQIWHDAVYPDGDVTLPDAAKWFNAEGEPVLYGPDRIPGAGEDSDEDIIVAREVISYKCPLTLKTMTDPYKSKLCNHTFEKQAIMELLQGGAKKCPQTGCDKTLSKADLVPDNVMRRRIERAAEMAAEDDVAATSDVEADEIGNATIGDKSIVEGASHQIRKREPSD